MLLILAVVLQSHLDIDSRAQLFHRLEWANEVLDCLRQVVIVMKIFLISIKYSKYWCSRSATKEVTGLATNSNHGASCEHHLHLSCARVYLHWGKRQWIWIGRYSESTWRQSNHCIHCCFLKGTVVAPWFCWFFPWPTELPRWLARCDRCMSESYWSPSGDCLCIAGSAACSDVRVGVAGARPEVDGAAVAVLSPRLDRTSLPRSCLPHGYHLQLPCLLGTCSGSERPHVHVLEIW